MRLPTQAELPFWGDPQAAPPLKPGTGEPRKILLGDRLIHYTLRRGRRRTIGLMIDHRGLRVGAPPRSPLHEIEALIRQHSGWVVDKLDNWRARPAALQTLVEDGLRFSVLGSPVVLRLQSGNTSADWLAASADGALPAQLVLGLRRNADPSAALEHALRERARLIFAERMQMFCVRFSISSPPLRLSSARTRWGSCSRLSGIRLNWRLIHAPLHLVDYVLAHELAHLREMNHTARFWREVERLYPDWQAARKGLRGFGDAIPNFKSPEL